MDDNTPLEEKEQSNESEKEKKKKKKKHKHKKHKSSDSEDEEVKKEEEQNQLILKDLIAQNFVLLHLIGQGAFGQIYISYNMRENLPVSIKKEIKRMQKTPQLKTEAKIYQSLLNIQTDEISGIKPLPQDDIQGVPKFYGYGEIADYYYLIIDFLGPNLIELFNYCGCQKFTISTVCLLALQMLNRIECIHKHHYLHRDIKPENFLIGMHDKSNIIYLIDFGLSKRYKNPKTHQHIPYREGRSLTGTARYVSINTHLGIEQSRRDDLESIGYVLIFFLKGVLPWQGLKNGNDKYTRIMEKKLQIPTEILCYGLPDEITYYLNYCKSLRFEDRPDYDYLRNLFLRLLGTCNTVFGLTKEMLKFDWCFEDPSTTIWTIFNKKNKQINVSNVNSSYTKDKEKENDNDQEPAPKKKNEVNLLKKQLSTVNEINDIKSYENNPNYEASSESGSENNKKKNKIDEKNLIKEEEEDKISESEETIRESFKPVPQDMEAGKLSEDLKTVFYEQSKEEQIDQVINKLMSAPPIPENNENLLKFNDNEKKNDNINNIVEQNNNNNDNKLRGGEKKLSNIKEEPEKKEISESGDKEKSKNDEEKKSPSAINIKNKQNESSLIESEKQRSGESGGKKSKTSKKSDLKNSQQIIENEKLDDGKRLQAAVKNSKNYSDDMKNKINGMKNDENGKLFKPMETLQEVIKEEENIKNDDEKKEERKEEKAENKIEEKKEEKIEEKKEEEKKEEEKKEEPKKEEEKVENKIEEKKEEEKSNPLDKLEDKKSENLSQMPNVKCEKEPEKENEAKKDDDDDDAGNHQYLKGFKTTKVTKKEKGKEKDSKDVVSAYRKNLRKKSYKSQVFKTPGGETPGGETPGEDTNKKMNLSKEYYIKISTEPVANYYTIVKDLGHGSYGQVKKVKHKSLGEIRAMKITNKKSDSSKYEIEILRKISHPNITNIFEIFADSKKYYVIMEFLEGGELFEAITSIGSFTEVSACKVMKQLLSAVFYLHSNNIVHRDLKPENIMLTQKPKNGNYQIKLIDFGTAKIFKPGKKMNKFIGTSYYIAPEVLKERYDEKCDVWSCGVILYILLCGYPPFNGNSNVDIFHAIQNQNPIFGGEEWEDITPEVKELIKLMLRKNPNERWSAEMCLKHKWFRMIEQNDRTQNKDKFKVIQMNAIKHMAQFVNENRFKQAVLQFISTQFNIQKEEGDLRELFKSMDTGGTGQLTKEEFQKKLVELYGENDGKELANNIFSNLDLDGSGKISYDEFLSAMISSKKVVTEERLEKAFKMFDKDNSGKLSVNEIKAVFGGTEAQWKKVIDEVDLNNDGEVDFAEFKIMMVNMDKNAIIEKRKQETEKSKDVSEE